MFKSPLTAEIPLQGLFNNDYRYWRAVIHETAPWLHFVLTTQEADRSRVQYVQLDSVHSFELVLHQLNPNQQITQLQVAIPARLNKLGRWTLEPLQDLLEGETPIDKVPIHLYRMKSGVTYLDGYVGDVDEEALESLRSIYVAPPSTH